MKFVTVAACAKSEVGWLKLQFTNGFHLLCIYRNLKKKEF